MAADRQRLAQALAAEAARRKMFESIPEAAGQGLPQAPERPMGWNDYLENLSIGLGRGAVNNLEGVKSAITSPIETAKGFATGVAEAVRNPRMVAEALKQTGQRAMSGPLGLGEVIGENVNMMRVPGTKPILNEIAEFDPRFDRRVKEQERLKLLTPNVESRGTVAPPEVSITQFEGRPFITSMSDRTAAGGLLRGVNDVEFRRPVNLQGGQDFMFENPGMVWASGTAPTKKIMKLAKEVKVLTGEDPLYIPWRMAPSGGDFASMTGETMLNYADAALNKTTRKAYDAEISKLIPNWAGIGTQEGIEQFRNAKDSVRKKIKNTLDTQFRDQGGLSIGEARLAVADPLQYTAPESGIQNIGVIHTDKPIIAKSGHAAYPAGVPGEGIGRVKEDVRIFELLNEAAKARNIADPRNPAARDVRALQMKPYYGRITAEILKKMGL